MNFKKLRSVFFFGGLWRVLVFGLTGASLFFVDALEASSCPDGLEKLSRSERIERLIAESQNGVTTRTGSFENVRIVYDAELDTIRYQSVLGRIPPGARALIPLHHGGGTIKSHSHAMIQPMHVFTAKAARRSQLMSFLHASPSRLLLAAEAIDAPGHGHGPQVDRFPKLENLVDWLAVQIRELKKSGLPVIPITRSASTGYFLELHRRYPDLLDGLVLMSPVDPIYGIKVGLKALHEQAAEGRVVLNAPGLDFVTQMYAQMDWSNLQSALKGLPILVLIGGRDVETPAETQSMMRYLVEGSHPLSRVMVEPNAGHEVLTVLDKEIGLRTFGAVQDFIFEIVKNSEQK